MHVQGAIQAGEVAVRQQISQLRAGEDAARRAHEGFQQRKLDGGQHDGPALHRDGVGALIQDDLPTAKDFKLLYIILRTAQGGAYAGHQLAHAEGFDHIIVGAQIQAQHGIGLFLTGGDDDDRGLTFKPVLTDKLITVHVGHHDVQQDQIGLFVAGHVDRILAVGRGEHPVALFGQVILQQLAYAGLIVNDEDRI